MVAFVSSELTAFKTEDGEAIAESWISCNASENCLHNSLLHTVKSMCQNGHNKCQNGHNKCQNLTHIFVVDGLTHEVSKIETFCFYLLTT